MVIAGSVLSPVHLTIIISLGSSVWTYIKFKTNRIRQMGWVSITTQCTYSVYAIDFFAQTIGAPTGFINTHIYGRYMV